VVTLEQGDSGPLDPAGLPPGLVAIYRNASVGMDLAVHLPRETDDEGPQGSETGKRLAVLRTNPGMVEHSIWVQSTD